MAWFLLNTSYISSQDRGGVFLEVYCSERKLSEQLNGKSTRERQSWPDKRMVHYQPFPSGMTSPLSDWITRKRESISGSCSQSEKTSQSREASPVRTSALLEKVLESRVSVQAFGVRCAESLLRFDRDTSSWKTPQCSLFGDLSESLPTLPKYGIALRGELWELPMLEQIIRGIGFGDSEPLRNTSTGKEIHIPTPTVMDAVRGGVRSCETDGNFRGIGLKHLVEDVPHKMWNTPTTTDSMPPRSEESLRNQAENVRPGRTSPPTLRDEVSQKDKWDELQKGDAVELFDSTPPQGNVKYPTPMSTEARQGYQNRNNGKKGSQKSLTTVVIEKGSQVRRQETTREQTQRKDYGAETENQDLTSCRITSSSMGGGYNEVPHSEKQRQGMHGAGSCQKRRKGQT